MYSMYFLNTGLTLTSDMDGSPEPSAFSHDISDANGEEQLRNIMGDLSLTPKSEINRPVPASSGEEDDDGEDLVGDEIEMDEGSEHSTGFTPTINGNDRPLRRIFTSGVLGNMLADRIGPGRPNRR
ncbi:hypothetical protein TREMEDRAFT_66018 [Tremella mesenterica DSM 1558]|uniref:uncharacterized protein n=1 Tax=Tremella mesenterica (strain ATCC 24925 / CBS 8224 / DSM 1558 / NBRC 9311 / NRRL Y-6157 / RJB 2259-6 / UBC 559-6) TaxID=578456 RepID=UPI00032C324C|nr:uncharacterized protein TREMEDRAFT_66018 [Tremella mesenterica DSM 1558]EIW65932.1 hypothetical protein TREMEDRAFT_66018 [Tremella mesenterica DSM 1558]